MKENKFRLLKADILAELNKLSQIERELSEVLDKIVEEPSSIELRAIGSILHDFYCGVENVFRIIANGLDGEIPDSEDWHIQLLNRMSLEIEDVRPAIVSPELHRDLMDYLRFRHLFRHVYGFELQWEKLQPLARSLSRTWQIFRKELDSLIEFINRLNNDTGSLD